MHSHCGNYDCLEEFKGDIEFTPQRPSAAPSLAGMCSQASILHMTPEEVYARVTSSETEIDSLWSELACARGAWVIDGKRVHAVLLALNNVLNGMRGSGNSFLNGLHPALFTSLSELEDLMLDIAKDDPWAPVMDAVIWTLRSMRSDGSHQGPESGRDVAGATLTTAECETRSAGVQSQMADIMAKNDTLDEKAQELTHLLTAEHTARTTEARALQSQVGSLAQEVQELRKLVEGERALSVALREDLCLRFGRGPADSEGSASHAEKACEIDVMQEVAALREAFASNLVREVADLRTLLRQEFESRNEEISTRMEGTDAALRNHVAAFCQQLQDTAAARFEGVEAALMKLGDQATKLEHMAVLFRPGDPSKLTDECCFERDRSAEVESQFSEVLTAWQSDLQRDRGAGKVDRLPSFGVEKFKSQCEGDIEGVRQAEKMSVAREVDALRSELREEFSFRTEGADAALRQHVEATCQHLNNRIAARFEVLEATLMERTSALCRVGDRSKCSSEKDQGTDTCSQISGVLTPAPPERINGILIQPPLNHIQKEKATILVKQFPTAFLSSSPRDRQGHGSVERHFAGQRDGQRQGSAAKLSHRNCNAASISTSSEDRVQVRTSTPMPMMSKNREVSQTRLVSPRRYRSGTGSSTPRPAQYVQGPQASPIRASSEPRGVVPVTTHQTVQTTTAPTLMSAGPGTWLSTASPLLARSQHSFLERL